jgi:response regulator RpfG family c-di-GMP phosphodiesterase
MHAEKAYDLILMDCEMPGMDGYETTLEIRSAERSETRTPIIAWTARVTSEESRKSLAGGFDDFMPKPIRRQMLLDLLDTWLAAPDAQESSAAPSQQEELDEVHEIFGDTFVELVALFRKDSPNRIAALYAAAAENDAMQIAKVAHAFSGSSASLGASTLSSLCRRLETNAREGTMPDLENQLDAIRQEYANVDARLRTMLAASGE